MTSLWIYMVLLIVLALLFVVVPVWRYRGGSGREYLTLRKEKNIEVFEQSMRELEHDLQENLVDREQFEKLEAELKRGFIRDMEALDTLAEKTANDTGKWVPLAFAMLIPVVSIIFYQGWGSGRDLVLPELLNELRNAENSEAQEAAINELADFLQARFDRLDGDVQNGYMLGTLYLELERHEEAVAIFSRLAEVTEGDQNRAAVFGQLAQAHYLASGQTVTEEVQNVIDQALELNSNEQAVMSLLAIDALLNDNFPDAVGYWRRQLSQLTPGSSQAQVLQQRIDTVEEIIAQGAPADDGQEAVAGPAIEVMVDIDDSIRPMVRDDMRVFIFARSPTIPAPLAARDFTVADLPLTITLDDSMAMAPMFRLSSAETVFVGARVSQAGGATAQPGDFQAISETFRLAENSEPVSLIIRDIVQ